MSNQTRQQVVVAVKAVENKKGESLAILEMDQDSGAFTDYFVVCTGTNPRQIQAISDEVEKQLSDTGVRPNSIEGYNQAEWVLLDYVDFVVHIFSTRAREFYGLERLWKSAERLTPADLAKKPAAKKAVKKIAAKRPAAKRASAPASSSTAKRKPSVKKGAKSKPRR